MHAHWSIRTLQECVKAYISLPNRMSCLRKSQEDQNLELFCISGCWLWHPKHAIFADNIWACISGRANGDKSLDKSHEFHYNLQLSW